MRALLEALIDTDSSLLVAYVEAARAAALARDWEVVQKEIKALILNKMVKF
jgi:hypothetical protein